MADLPNTLTYFGDLNTISRVVNKSELPLLEAHQLGDPFLPDRYTPLPFSREEMFEASVKYITQAVLGKSAPGGRPNHPLQKAISRWRAEDRFKDEEEIKVVMQSLLPAIVDKAFHEASAYHQAWIDYVSSHRSVPFYENVKDLSLWQRYGHGHKGAAITFSCADETLFQHCHPVVYQKVPSTTVSQQLHIEQMVGMINDIELDPQRTLLTQDYAQRQLKEWRLIADNGDEEQWLKFPAGLIRSVYLGALVPEQSVMKFKQYLANLDPAIRVFRAYGKPAEYRLDFA